MSFREHLRPSSAEERCLGPRIFFSKIVRSREVSNMYAYRAAVINSTAFCYFQVSILCMNFLYSGCMIENVLMSGCIWFSSLSPIEMPSGSAAMNAGRMSGDKRGTKKWMFVLGSTRFSLNAIFNFAIFLGKYNRIF